MRTLLERIEAKTKTGITLRVLSGGQDSTVPKTLEVAPAKPVASKDYQVDPNAGIPVGKTVERDGLRLHRYNSSLRVTDLANAGKRGKTCPEFALFNLDYGTPDAKRVAEVEAALKAIARAPTYAQAVAIALGVAAPARGMVVAGMEERSLRGVDVEPAKDTIGRVIKIETPTFTLEAGATDFTVSEKVRPGHGGDDTRILMPPVGGAKKAAIKAFYGWVKQNLNDIKGMTFRNLRSAMSDAGLAYHSFSTMD